MNENEYRRLAFEELENAAQSVSAGQIPTLIERHFHLSESGKAIASGIYQFDGGELAASNRLRISIASTDDLKWTVAFRPVD